MDNVLSWLEVSTARFPRKAAFTSEGVGGKRLEVTFLELRDTARMIGSLIAASDNNWSFAKSPIAVFSMRAATTPILFMACVYAGHAYAPIDVGMPALRIGRIIANLRPRVIIVDKACQEEFVAISACDTTQSDYLVYVIDFDDSSYEVYNDAALRGPVKAGSLSEELIDEDALSEVMSDHKGSDPLYIIHTSGSSGRPKGVVTSHESLINYIDSYGDVMRIDEGDVLGNQSPLDYIAAIRDIYLPLKYGASTYIIPKSYFMNPNELFRCLNDNNITTVGWSVSALTVPLSLGAFEDVNLSSLSKICFSGSVMPCKALRVWQDNLPDAVFVNQYGPTETTASCTYYVIDHFVEDDEVLPIGEAYDGYDVFLTELDDDTKLVTDEDRRGQICVAGISLAIGYINDEVRTDDSFVVRTLSDGSTKRIYKTGDIGSIRDGQLMFHGRMDRQIKHMGHRVELDEVEYAASTLGGVDESLCIYDKNKEKLILFYTGDCDKRELTLGLRELLPGFMVPRKVKRLESLPKLPSGKIDMPRLIEQT